MSRVGWQGRRKEVRGKVEGKRGLRRDGGKEREEGMETGRKDGRERGGRKKGREGGRKKRREGGRKKGRERRREGGREGGRNKKVYGFILPTVAKIG